MDSEETFTKPSTNYADAVRPNSSDSENETFISKPSTSYADVVKSGSSFSESPMWLRSFQLEDVKEAFEKAIGESLKVTLLIKYLMLNFCPIRFVFRSS